MNKTKCLQVYPHHMLEFCGLSSKLQTYFCCLIYDIHHVMCFVRTSLFVYVPNLSKPQGYVDANAMYINCQYQYGQQRTSSLGFFLVHSYLFCFSWTVYFMHFFFGFFRWTVIRLKLNGNFFFFFWNKLNGNIKAAFVLKKIQFQEIILRPYVCLTTTENTVNGKWFTL